MLAAQQKQAANEAIRARKNAQLSQSILKQKPKNPHPQAKQVDPALNQEQDADMQIYKEAKQDH